MLGQAWPCLRCSTRSRLTQPDRAVPLLACFALPRHPALRPAAPVLACTASLGRAKPCLATSSLPSDPDHLGFAAPGLSCLLLLLGAIDRIEDLRQFVQLSELPTP